ncbi:hypothetical protein J4558_23615 [Leptolyngbya sp. 15MV]|nr:hypothetical protein J4558_23615 [Leptolyngbya sp. 15MV]
MPQIAQLAETYASQIFWLLVFFGFVFLVVGRGMVPKVMATVAERDGQIAADLAAATAARAQADAEEEAWRKREIRRWWWWTRRRCSPPPSRARSPRTRGG